MMEETNEIQMVPLGRIDESPFQGRFLDFNQRPGEQFLSTEKDIEELARSISKAGLLQPVLLRPLNNGKFELIDGHRRLVAYRFLGKSAIPAIVRSMSDRDAQIQSIVGNLQRKNLTKIELASAYRKVLDNGLFSTAKELSVALGKDETFVADTLNLLKLDNQIIDDLGRNDTIKDVRLLRQIRKYAPIDEAGRSPAQYELYKRVIDEKLTREDVWQIVKRKNTKADQEVPFYKIFGRSKRVMVELNTRNFSPDKREMLERVLREKMNELESLFGRS